MKVAIDLSGLLSVMLLYLTRLGVGMVLGFVMAVTQILGTLFVTNEKWSHRKLLTEKMKSKEFAVNMLEACHARWVDSPVVCTCSTHSGYVQLPRLGTVWTRFNIQTNTTGDPDVGSVREVERSVTELPHWYRATSSLSYPCCTTLCHGCLSVSVWLSHGRSWPCHSWSQQVSRATWS